VLPPAAAGADEAVRPAPAEHRLPAPILAPVKLIEAPLAEPLLKLTLLRAMPQPACPFACSRFVPHAGRLRKVRNQELLLG
jgi:hypothetical protein